MKYNNIPCTVNGKSFQSKLEGGRYAELCLLESAGEISGLGLQSEFRLEINGVLICKYRADFTYLDERGNYIVEDTKSIATKTPVYNIKKRLMRAIHGIEIKEVYAVKRKISIKTKTTRSRKRIDAH